MTKWRVRAAAVAAIVTAAALVSACEDYPEPRHGGGFVIVSGYRSNMPPPSLTGMARSWLEEAAYAGDELFIVSVDGFPEQVGHKKFDPDCNRNKAACESFEMDEANKIDARLRLDAAKADEPEADLLEAIVLAARLLEKIDGPKHIAVIDSGLQTTGLLPMATPGAFKADPAEVVKPLLADERYQLLKDVDVLFSGLGTYAEPQGQLADGDVAALEKLWRGILSGLGAEVTIDSAAISGTPPGDLPFVTVVKEEVRAPQDTPCFLLQEDEIGFLPNVPDLRDPAHAREVLRPIADRLVRTGVVATLIGTTALPDGDQHWLSNARAATVKRILVDELAVPAEKLFTVGVGINFTRYRDPYINGIFSEIIGRTNRLVIVQPVGQSC